MTRYGPRCNLKTFFVIIAVCGFSSMMFISRLRKIRDTNTMANGSDIMATTGNNNLYGTTGSNKLYSGNNVSFLVNTVSCRIPDLDPMDPSIRDVIGVPNEFKCDKFPSLAYQNDQTLTIDWKAIKKSKYKGLIKYCTVSPIIRPVDSTTNHDSWKELSPSVPFNESHYVKDEFVHMKCYDASNRKTYENYYAFAVEKEIVEKKCKENMLLRKKKFADAVEPVSVMVLGLDSVSRLNSMRYMKNTRNYLAKELDAIELLGYNKVGYGTIHNISPFLMGKYLSELPWDFKKPVIFDNFKFIWDEYSDMGYRTMYVEDYPQGSTFDYKKPGFHKTPTDYYDRHFHMAFEGRREFWYQEQNCFMDKSQTDIILDYTTRFMSKFKSELYFGYSFITRLTHDYIERTAMADDLFLNFLKRINNDNLLNNTILIFMSDHGMRFGDIRNRYIGKMESRLPTMFVVLPKWFQHKYPEVLRNLRVNTRRLTTHFDMHETLKHILSFNGKPRTVNNKTRAYSIFDNIPETRSCSDASIESHWCTCSELVSVVITDSMVQQGAHFLVNKINKFLESSRKLCEVLYLDQIEFAYKIIPLSKEMSELYQGYQITILVKPGGGAFEGTIIYDKKKNSHRLSSDVSRTNAYGKQKRCAVDHELEQMCFCK